MKSLKINITNSLHYLQKVKIETLSNEHRLLYNFLLSSIKEKSLTFKELNQLYKQYRKENQLTINSKSSQNTCISLINSIKSFYVLKKKDITVKFPYKFRSWKYFTSFMLDYNNGSGGFKIKDNALYLNLIDIKHKLEIKLPEYCKQITNENIKTITFKRENHDDYYVIFVYSETPSNHILDKDKFLSIDLGYSQLVTCFSNATNNFSISNMKLKKLERRIELIQSKKDKHVKNSIRYKKLNKTYKRLKSKQVNKVKDFQHKVSKIVVDKCINNNIGQMIVGDLKVKKIQSKDNYGLSGISKSTLALSRFKTFLEYKAKNANIDFIKVNEAFSSQQNCLTGEIMFSSDLSNRSVEIESGVFIDRDLNAAVNIAKKIRAKWLSSYLCPEVLGLNRMFVDCESNLQMIKIL
jgi:putative transposase